MLEKFRPKVTTHSPHAHHAKQALQMMTTNIQISAQRAMQPSQCGNILYPKDASLHILQQVMRQSKHPYDPAQRWMSNHRVAIKV